MKKLLCFCLAAVLLLAAALPAAASQDEELKAILPAVKAALDISDDYTYFNADSRVVAGHTWWSLSWDMEGESLYVGCDEAGRVCRMNLWREGDYDYSYYGYSRPYELHFPDFTYDDAVAAAQTFLAKVLDKAEGVRFDSRQDSLRGGTTYYLNGILTLNGVDTETWVSLNLRTADGGVIYFSRSDEGTVIEGGVPSPVPAFDAAAALPKFRSVYSAVPQWTLTEEHAAKLVYVVTPQMDAMLDAQTGELLSRSYYGYGYGSEAPMEAAVAEEADDAVRELTPAELAGAEKLTGCLDGEALFAAARQEPAFGLTEDYILGSVRYTAAQPSMDPALLEEGAARDDGVTASYSLNLPLESAAFGLTEKEFADLQGRGCRPEVQKWITADAFTGEVLSISTYYSGFGWRETEKSAPTALSAAAKDFLERRYGDELPLCGEPEIYQSTWNVPVNRYSYTRMEAGYPCPMNSISLSVNAATGFVDSFRCAWDEELTFGAAGPVVGEDAAVDSLLACYDAKLSYVLLPENADDWETVWHWKLVYTLQSEGYVWQVDALTGEADYITWDGNDDIAYTDLAGSYAAAEIEKLASFGVGFRGVGEFRPTAKVTELDMLLLMLSVNGYWLDYEEYAHADGEALAWLYAEGVSYGFLTSREQRPDRLVTRSELCRCFVGLSYLQAAAELPGIFRCGFTDEDAIAPEDVGYIAIAKGLGVVKGDRNGAFRPNDGATRQELAVMLYRYLDR